MNYVTFLYISFLETKEFHPSPELYIRGPVNVTTTESLQQSWIVHSLTYAGKQYEWIEQIHSIAKISSIRGVSYTTRHHLKAYFTNNLAGSQLKLTIFHCRHSKLHASVLFLTHQRFPIASGLRKWNVKVEVTTDFCFLWKCRLDMMIRRFTLKWCGKLRSLNLLNYRNISFQDNQYAKRVQIVFMKMCLCDVTSFRLCNVTFGNKYFFQTSESNMLLRSSTSTTQ